MSEAWAATCVTVPCFPELTDAEVDTVAAALGRLAEAETGR
jgi:dTDP-4-amino-4,6-dideoxygalactose transaminase